jgi:tetratricopeptide (TPR) repeat protein
MEKNPRSEGSVNKARAHELFEAAYDYHRRGELDKAIEFYEESIALYPTAEAHTFIGWAHSHKGDYQTAIEECQRAIEVDPDFGNPYNDIGAYLIELGQPDAAIPYLERAMVAKRYECYQFPHYNMGRVLELKGRWRDAIAAYKKAWDILPEYELAKRAYFRVMGMLN